jgi:IS5 family transposase
VVDTRSVLAKRGLVTGPNPTDCGKAGSKQHVGVDRHGIPLLVTLTAANEHDSIHFAGLIAALSAVKQRHGYRRKRPDKAHADKGYENPRCHRVLAVRGIRVRIARRKVEGSERLGRHRWVVVRSLAWLARYRKLALHVTFLTLACALVCIGRLANQVLKPAISSANGPGSSGW